LESVGRNTLINWLYCLNWHTKDLRRELQTDKSLTEQQKQKMERHIKRLDALKTDVLLKMLSEGYATVRGIHKIDVPRYCIRLGRNHTFHITINAKSEKAVKAYEDAVCAIRKHAPGAE